MQSSHGTLTAATVATVSVGADVVDNWKAATTIEVLNRSGSAEIFFTLDGSAPTVAGPNTYIVPAAIGSVMVDVTLDGPVTVKLISTGTPTYSVLAP